MKKLVYAKNDVEKTVDWKIYFDTTQNKPCGIQGRYVAVCAPDEMLPPIINKPDSVEEREAVLIIFKKRKKRSV